MFMSFNPKGNQSYSFCSFIFLKIDLIHPQILNRVNITIDMGKVFQKNQRNRKLEGIFSVDRALNRESRALNTPTSDFSPDINQYK